MRPAGLGILLCLLVAGSLQIAGAERTTRGSNESTGTSGPLIIVTQDAQEGPPTCRPHRLAERLVRFTDALAAVDGRALRRFWAKDFYAFTFGSAQGPILLARSPRHALKYLRKHGGLDVRLTEVRFNVRNFDDHPADIVFSGVFVPQGETSELQMGGKGYASCDSRTIPLWNMVVRPEADYVSCPPPPTPPPEGVDTLIVCNPH